MMWIDFDTEDLYIRGYDNEYMKIDTEMVNKKNALEISERLIQAGMEILNNAKDLKETK